jgi:hypothetical protein
MSLLGERTWYLPGSLRWLPALDAGHSEPLTPAAP